MDDFEDGKTIKRWERSRYNAVARLCYTENRCELLEAGEVVYREYHRRSPELRSQAVSELKAL